MMLALRLMSTFMYSFILAFFIERAMKCKINRWVFIMLIAVPDVIITYFAHYSPYFAESFIPSFNVRTYIKAILITLKLILFIFFFFEDSIKKKIKVFIVFQAFMAIVEMLAGFVISNALHITAQENWELPLDQYIISFLASAVLYFLGMFLAYRICGGKDLNISTSLLVMSAVIVLFNCALVAFVATSYSDNSDIITRIFLAASPVFILLLVLVLLYTMSKISSQKLLEEKIFWSENVKEIEYDYYKSIQEKSNEIRQIRHDFKGTIDTVRLLIDENTKESNDRAGEILTSLNESISSTKIPVYTRNVVVNAVLGAKVEEAKKKKIQTDIRIELPDKLPIDSIDLNSVFLNLLNNSIEACEKLQESEKRVSIKATVKSGFLVIKTENPYQNITLDENKRLITQKTDKYNHGIGMTLINDIAKKYEGDVSVIADNNIFNVTVILKAT